MPSIACRCGEVLKFGEIPNSIEFLFISDVQFDGFGRNIDSESLYRSMRSILCCPNCRRLWFFWDGFDREPIPYLLEAE
jgi:hypothetical protein